MYLGGRLKSADGVNLDCSGDGKGEGGYLPAYETQLYNAKMIEQKNNSPEMNEILRHRREQ